MDINLSELIIHLVLWMLGFLFLFRIFYCKASNDPPEQRKRVSIIIPARNEERTLPLLLASLKEQKPYYDEVIVVDDNSEDNTRLVAAESGVSVILADQPPEGWRGKTWACYQGATRAKGDILVFLDADTVIENGGIKKILDTYTRSGAVISIQPYHRMKKLYEQFSAFFNIILMAAIGSFSILGNKVKSIGLFGPAMVISRKQYDAAGGHESVKGEVVEDLSLGIKLKQEGVPIRCFGGRKAVSFRMYPGGMKQMVEGWSKGLATGATKTSIPVLIMIVAWIVGAIDSFRYFILFTVMPDSLGTLIWGGIYLLYVIQIYWMLYRIGNFGIYTAILYPLPLAFFVCVFAYSAARVFLRRKVRWKGRDIDIRKPEQKP